MWGPRLGQLSWLLYKNCNNYGLMDVYGRYVELGSIVFFLANLELGHHLAYFGMSSMNFRMDFYTMMVINSRGMGLP